MTAEEARAYEARLEQAVSKLHTIPRPPDWRRRRCGEMKVTETERLAMQAFHYALGESYSALARRFRRDRHYVPRWIWTKQYRVFHAFSRGKLNPAYEPCQL